MKKIFIFGLLLVGLVLINCAHRSGRKKLKWAEDTVEVVTKVEDCVHEVTQRRSVSPLLDCVVNMQDSQLMVKDGYVVLYSLKTHCPVYSAWELTRERVDGEVSRCKKFFPDNEVDELHRVTNDDFRGSGWSRGHMCPAADNKDTELRMEESCLLTNICPQDMSLNNGDWNELENRCRNWVRKGKEPLYIICGPIFNTNRYGAIGENVSISVPDGFFKVILFHDEYNGVSNAIGFVYPNEAVNNPMKDYCVPVDSVEAITGIDFFSQLPDDIEETVEGICDMNFWGFH